MHSRPPSRRAPRKRAGFTLVELLLVVVISLLAMSMAIPLFAQASRSNKLRTAARTVVAAHRFARGMAVLRQADMVLLLDEEQGRIQVVSLEKEEDPESEDGSTTNGASSSTAEAEFLLGAQEDAAFTPTNTVNAELDRPLPDGVRIDRIDVDEMQRHERTAWVDYQPNGMCDPFEVDLADDRGRIVTIRIIGATGKAEVLDE